ILLRSPASELSRDQPLRFRRIGLRAALQRRSILAQGLTCRLCGSPLAGWDRNLEEPDGEPGGADLSRLRARNGSPVGKCEVALSIRLLSPRPHRIRLGSHSEMMGKAMRMQRRTTSATMNGSTPWPAIHSRVKVALGPRVARRKSRSSRRECRFSRSRSLGRIDLQHTGRGSIWHSEQKPLTDQCAVGRRILAIRSEKLENSKGSPPCSESSGEPPTSFCAATQTNSTPQHAGRPLSLRDFGRFCQSVGVRLDRACQATSLVNRSNARGGGLYWRVTSRRLAWGE